MLNKLFFAFLSVLLLPACAAMEKNPDLQVFAKKKDRNFKGSTVLICSFSAPQHAPQSGPTIGRIFHEILTQKKIFDRLEFDETPWEKLAVEEKDRLPAALAEARKRSCDYVLVGEVLSFIEGGLNQTRVRLRCRVISVSDAETVFFAENSRQESGRDPSYPLDTRLVEPSPTAEALARRVIRELAQKI